MTRLESSLMFPSASFRPLDSTTRPVTEHLLSTTFLGPLLGGATGPVPEDILEVQKPSLELESRPSDSSAPLMLTPPPGEPITRSQFSQC